MGSQTLGILLFSWILATLTLLSARVYANSPGEKSHKVAGPGRVEEGLNVPHVSLEGLELHAAADAQNLLDLDLAARPRKARKSSDGGFAVSS